MRLPLWAHVAFDSRAFSCGSASLFRACCCHRTENGRPFSLSALHLFVYVVFAGCDWVRFYDESGKALTSQLSGETFPGLRGMEPLVVPASKCRMHFHTDGYVMLAVIV
jgi:hypothetical protein